MNAPFPRALPFCATCVAALLSFVVVAVHADPVVAGHRGLVSDGQGNIRGARGNAFATANGEGLRTQRFSRNADGSLSASGQAQASGTLGQAERSGSFTRSADGSASGERSTRITNSNTGVTLDGATTYTQGSGVSRSASCRDASGQSVACGAQR